MQNRFLFSLVLLFVSSLAWGQRGFPTPNPTQATLLIQAQAFTAPSSCATADGKIRITLGVSSRTFATTGGSFMVITRNGETERRYVSGYYFDFPVEESHIAIVISQTSSLVVLEVTGFESGDFIQDFYVKRANYANSNPTTVNYTFSAAYTLSNVAVSQPEQCGGTGTVTISGDFSDGDYLVYLDGSTASLEALGAQYKCVGGGYYNGYPLPQECKYIFLGFNGEVTLSNLAIGTEITSIRIVPFSFNLNGGVKGGGSSSAVSCEGSITTNIKIESLTPIIQAVSLEQTTICGGEGKVVIKLQNGKQGEQYWIQLIIHPIWNIRLTVKIINLC